MTGSVKYYAFDADVWCEDCLIDAGVSLSGGEASPVSEGVGDEADTPQHCSACGTFLESRLTEEGARYVVNALAEHANGRGRRKVLVQWAEYYEEEIVEHCDLFLRDGAWIDRDDLCDAKGTPEALLAALEEVAAGTREAHQVTAMFRIVASPAIDRITGLMPEHGQGSHEQCVHALVQRIARELVTDGYVQIERTRAT